MKPDLSKLTNEQLGEIYEATVGYNPYKENLFFRVSEPHFADPDPVVRKSMLSVLTEFQADEKTYGPIVIPQTITI